MDQGGEVYFLKLSNGEDILCQLIGDEDEYIFITQPYRVELMQSPSTMTVTTTIMRWIPFDSLMEETICLDKKNILTFMEVDDTVAVKYLNTISEQSKETRRKAAEQMVQEKIRDIYSQITANTSGKFH